MAVPRCKHVLGAMGGLGNLWLTSTWKACYQTGELIKLRHVGAVGPTSASQGDQPTNDSSFPPRRLRPMTACVANLIVRSVTGLCGGCGLQACDHPPWQWALQCLGCSFPRQHANIPVSCCATVNTAVRLTPCGFPVHQQQAASAAGGPHPCAAQQAPRCEHMPGQRQLQRQGTM
jgi:hypothetical protein